MITRLHVDNYTSPVNFELKLAATKRNIETWIHYLRTPPADEERDYKPKSAEDCKLAARTLAGLGTAPDDAPDWLKRFIQGLRRVAGSTVSHAPVAASRHAV